MAEAKKEAKKDTKKDTKEDTKKEVKSRAKSAQASGSQAAKSTKATKTTKTTKTTKPATKSSSTTAKKNKSTTAKSTSSSSPSKKKSSKKSSKKSKVILGILAAVVLALIAIAVTIFLLTRPLSKEDAANEFADMLDKYNSKLVDIKNDVKVLDIDKMRSDAEEMVKNLESNIEKARDLRWPEGLSDDAKRLSGEKVSDMELYARDLEKKKDYFQSIIDADDDHILNVYKEDEPYGVIDTDDFRQKLGLPSKAAEKNKYHEYTDDEVTKKLQETALDVNLGKYYIDCKEDYGHVSCDSNLDATVRNKSKVNLTNGGVIEVTAYDTTGNPIETETFYIGNRLEKGQTAKQKMFDYVRDEYRNDYLNKPSFKVTKIQLY